MVHNKGFYISNCERCYYSIKDQLFIAERYESKSKSKLYYFDENCMDFNSAWRKDENLFTGFIIPIKTVMTQSHIIEDSNYIKMINFGTNIFYKPKKEVLAIMNDTKELSRRK